MLDRAGLMGRSWTFRWDQGEVITEELTLLANGRIGAIGKHHVYWDIIEACLCFLNEERYCTFRFNVVDRRDDGTYGFSGRFTLLVGQVRTVTLTEICTPIPALLQMFESLGDNCEFGIVQRYYGAEPLGLLRFSWISMAFLMKGLADRFAGFDDPESVTLRLASNREYFGVVKEYGMQFHTDKSADHFAANEVIRTVRQRLLFTRRKFLEDLDEGNKIYVRKGEGSASLKQVLPLFERLKTMGNNKLLWVTLADDTHPPGHVEQVDEGLWHGYVRTFAPADNVAGRVTHDTWAKVCRAVASTITPRSLTTAACSTIKWTALERTYVKATVALSASLKEDEKIAVNEGTMLEAGNSSYREGHIEVTEARLDGVELPERIWFLYAPAWARV